MFSLIGSAILQSFSIGAPDVAIVVLEPDFDGRPAITEALVRDTETVLRVLQRDGHIRYHPARVGDGRMPGCLEFGSQPSEERRTCVRKLLPAAVAGYPLVAILVGYTGERGAWQRMECVRSSGNGIQRYVYVNEVRHPSADISRRARLQVLQCVQDALKPEATKSDTD